jgi:hypothetical protein
LVSEFVGLVLETEALKVQKIEQTKFLKDQTNQQDHKRKLQVISFTAKTHQKGKDDDQKRKHDPTRWVSSLAKFINKLR